MGIRPQKHKRSDRIILLGYNEVINLFERFIKVMIGYLTSYIKVSPFVSFRPHAHLRFILDRCDYTPKELWVKLRTTNVIERSFREVRRRTRTISCFNNTPSIERIVYAMISRLNDQWSIKPLREFTQNY